MTIRKWRRSDLSCETVLRGHEKGVLSLKLLGDMLFAGDRKGEIKLWKVSDGEIERDRARSSEIKLWKVSDGEMEDRFATVTLAPVARPLRDRYATVTRPLRAGGR